MCYCLTQSLNQVIYYKLIELIQLNIKCTCKLTLTLKDTSNGSISEYVTQKNTENIYFKSWIVLSLGLKQIIKKVRLNSEFCINLNYLAARSGKYLVTHNTQKHKLLEEKKIVLLLLVIQIKMKMLMISLELKLNNKTTTTKNSKERYLVIVMHYKINNVRKKHIITMRYRLKLNLSLTVTQFTLHSHILIHLLK